MNTFVKKINPKICGQYLAAYLIPALILLAMIPVSNGLFGVFGIFLIPLSAISFLFFLLHTSFFSVSSHLLTLSFSCAYALSGFCLANNNSVKSLLCYILLPLLFLSLDVLLAKGSFLPITLIFSLLLCIEPITGCILFFYLIGFVILIPECPIGKRVADLLHITLLFLFALGLSAAFSIPQLHNFFASVSKNPYTGFSINYPWANLLARFLPGSVLSSAFSSGRGMDLYCGLLSFFGLVLYFFNNTISFKKRMRTLLYTLLVLLTLQTTPFQYLIELYNVTDTAYLYYSFFFVFLVLMLACEAIGSLSEYYTGNLTAGLCITFFMIITALIGSAHNYIFAALLLIGSFLVLYIILLPFVQKERYPHIKKILCFVLLAELAFNGLFCSNTKLIPSSVSLEDRFALSVPQENKSSSDITADPIPNEEAYISFYEKAISNEVYGTFNAVNQYVSFTSEEETAYNPHRILDFFEEFNLKCHKLGIDTDILQTSDATISFDTSDLYEITDETNRIYNFHSYHKALSYDHIIIPYTVEFQSPGIYLIYDNISGNLMRFDITKEDLSAKGYLSLAPSEEINLNFRLNVYSFDEDGFQTVPDLLVDYMSANNTSFSSMMYLIYFVITCICILILLALTVNHHKKPLLMWFSSQKEAVMNWHFYEKALHWFRENAVYLAAFAVPFFLFVISMILFSCEPFGSQSFLDEDGYPSVLASSLGYYHNLKSGNTVLSMLMGYATNIYSASNTVYTAFLLPFSPSSLPSVLLLSEAVLLGLCGFSVVYYLTHRWNGPKAYKKDFRLLAPAFLYTINAFMLAMHSYVYSWYLLFFILPLLILSVERLLYQRKWFGYTILLALSIFTNTNIALYLCIFLVLYFFTCRFENFTDFIRKGLRFTVFSLLAALCSLCNIITILLGVTGSGYSEKDSIFPSFGFHGSFFDQWKKLMIFTPSGAVNTNDGGINLYMSLLCLVLLAVFLTNRCISLRRKLTFALPSAFLLFSFNEQILSYMWNGMHYQSNVPNRYVFLLVFLCSIMAYDGLLVIRRQSILKMSLLCLSAVAFLTLCQFVGDGNALFCYVCSLALILLYLLLHLIYKKFPKYRRFYYPVMILVLFAELSANWFYTCTTFSLTSPIPYGDYETQSEVNTSLLADADSFSRFCTPATFCLNTGNFSNTPNGNVFISTLSTFQQTLNSLYGNYGGDNFICSNYDSTPWGQSVAANGYISVPLYATQTLRDLAQYEYIGYANQCYLFKNPDALHLGFYIPLDLATEFDTASLPDFMNIFTDCYTANSYAPLLTPLALSVNTGEENSITFLNNNLEKINIAEADAILSSPKTAESASSANSSLYLKMDFTPAKSGQVYLSLNEFICLGYYTAGEKASITIPYPNKTPDISKEYFLYTFDDDVYEKFIREVSKNQLENITIDDNVITATSDYEEDGYTMLSLPYDENWKAYIDGIEVPVENVLNSAVFVHTPAGSHEIKLVYDVTIYQICTWISFITTFAVILIYCFLKRRRPSCFNTDNTVSTNI